MKQYLKIIQNFYIIFQKKQYFVENKKSIKLIFKIMMNSFYGSTLTDKTRFKDIKICTTKEQALKLTKKPNFNSFNNVNENLIIIEMSKNKCIFDSPILIGSTIPLNSKCNLYNYMYNIIPKLFGRENIIFSARDTDSIIYKIKNRSHKKYLEILKNNPQYFSEVLGLMTNEILENIKEVISLMSRCYSIQTDDNKISRRTKGIPKSYSNKNHTHEYLKKYYLMKMKIKKLNFIEHL